MKSKLISFILALSLLIAIPLSALYKYNPFTRKLDYYEPVSGSDLGDLGDVTLTGLAAGNVLYYNGTAWVNLATGANGTYLSLAAGIPAWGAVAGVTTFLGLTDTPGTFVGAGGNIVRVNALATDLEFTLESAINHDGLTNWAANKHVVLPNTLVATLTDHDLAAHTVLGLFDASADVDHNATTNYDANQHVDHTAVSILSAGLITGGGTIDGTQTLTLTEATIEAAIDTLANLTSIQGQTVTFSGSLNVEANSNINQDVTSDGSPTFGGLTVTNIFSYDYTTDHNLLVGYLAGQDLTAGQGQYNTLLGELAGADVTTGDYNIIIGYNAGRKITTNVSNILIGRDIASVSTSQAHSNVIIGDTAAIELTNGYENIIIGKEAARDIKSAGLNVIIGWQASLEHETGNENTIIGNQAGVGVAGSSNYGFNTFIGASAGQYVLTAGANNVLIGYQAAQDLTSGASNIVIGYMAGEGWLDTESEKLVIDVTDTATPLIYGDFSADNITINGDFDVTMDAAADQVLFSQSSESGTENQPLVWIDDAREGATVDEWLEASLRINAEDWALGIVGQSYFEGDTTQVEDVFITWDSVADHAVIAQSSGTGTEGQPLIFINDDRTGTTANSIAESTLVIDAEGTFALYVKDGDVWLAGGNLTLASPANLYLHDDLSIYQGTGNDIRRIWATNLTGDDLLINAFVSGGVNTTAIAYANSSLTISAMTDHDNYLTPTFVLMNNQGADAGDYAGVVIGERTQADVKVAHYFDFYAMTGAGDGSVDPANAELGATFRFGDAGSAVPDNATGPGDVLFEDDVEVDGNTWLDGTFDVKDWIKYNTSSYSQTYGYQAGNSLAVGGERDVLIGYQAGYRVTTADHNVAIGNEAMYYNDLGHGNVIIGSGAGKGETGQDYDYNVVIGYQAGFDMIQDANWNVYIGRFAGKNNNYGDRNVFVGDSAGLNEAGSDKLYIENSSSATPLIHGDFDIDIITINGDFHVTGEIESGVYVVSAVVNFDDGSPVAICSVADGYIVTDVFVEITTTWDGNGTITVGDGGDPDGYMEDAGIDQGTADYYGHEHDERGVYLWHVAGSHTDCYIYAGADTVDATLVAGTSTQGIATVYVQITRLK